MRLFFIRPLAWCLLALLVAACSGSDEIFIDVRRARYVFYGALGEEYHEIIGPRPIIMDRLLDKVILADGRVVDLLHAVGSGLFRREGDPPDVYYALSDRGPTLACHEAVDRAGEPLCRAGTVFVLPEYAPTIHTLHLDFNTGEYDTLAELPILATAHIPVSGLPNPGSGESAFDASGLPLPVNPAGLDPEALVRLTDGTFWLAEEYGPSLVQVRADGVVQKRLVPAGRERDLAQALYPVLGVLPAGYADRRDQGGFSALVVDKGETTLTTVLARPLASAEAGVADRAVRVLALDLATLRPRAEYAYVLDGSPNGFPDGSPDGLVDAAGSGPRVSAAVSVNRDALLVMEWMPGRARVYLADLRRATNLLEPLDGTRELQPASKRLILEIGSDRGEARPLEGMVLYTPATLVLADDNAWGLGGDPTVFRLIDILKQSPMP